MEHSKYTRYINIYGHERLITTFFHETCTEAADYLEELAAGTRSPADPYAGICTNFSSFSNRRFLGRNSALMSRLFYQIIAEYPEHSGAKRFPIRCPSECKGKHLDNKIPRHKAAAIYQIYRGANKNMWDPDDPYGAARLKLCEWAASEFRRFACETL